MKNYQLRCAFILPLVALTVFGMALLPSQILAQSCLGGFCGSGEGLGDEARIEVNVSISISPKDSGVVRVNDTELTSGLFSALQGDALVLEAVPNSGYVFDRWSDWFDESDSRVEAPIYNHKTLTAHFVEVSASKPAPVKNSDTGVVTIPEGTVALGPTGAELNEVSVQLRQPRALPSEGILLGDVYELRPDGATFDPPIPITLPYDSVPEGVDEQTLSIASFDSSTQDWVVLPSVVNYDDRTVVAEINHFSEYAIVAEVQPGSAPLITPGFSFSSLTVTPKTPYAGQDVEVSVEASYMGGNSQAKSLVFVTLDEQIADETEIVLSPGDRVSVILTVRAPQEGSADVGLNGLSETITVSGEPPPPELNQALTQAVALAEQDELGVPAVAPSSPLTRWPPAAYVVGAIVLLLLSGPLFRCLWRQMLRRRYDL